MAQSAKYAPWIRPRLVASKFYVISMECYTESSTQRLTRIPNVGKTISSFWP